MYNTDSDSLNAGAPDIRLSGNQDPNQQMAMSDESNTQLLESLYEEFFGMGFSPADAARKAQEAFDQMSRAPQQNSGIMASAPGTYTQQRKQMMAGGGIAGLEKRQGYFLGGIGDFFGSVKDKVVDDLIPNELKNPLGIAALIGASTKIPGPTQGWLGDLLGTIGDKYPVLEPITSGAENIGEVLSGIPGSVYQGVTGKEFDAENIIPSIISGITGAASPYFGTEGSRRVNPLYPLGIGAAVGKYVEGLPKDTLPMDTTSIDPAAIAAAARGTDAEGAAAGLRFLPEQVTRAAEGGRMGYAGGADYYSNLYSRYAQEMIQAGNIPIPIEDFVAMIKEQEGKAQGGRIGAQEGGLMNLGGMEKDYRNEGGFVALGGKEKADDVPARLSKNEFVFTADAVRNAGGGDIDKGAEIMEDLMNNLEGARGMFANAQKLQNRII